MEMKEQLERQKGTRRGRGDGRAAGEGGYGKAGRKMEK